MVTVSRAGLGQIQEPGIPFGSLCWVYGGPSPLVICCCFISTLVVNQVGIETTRTRISTHKEYRHLRQLLNILYHNTDPNKCPIYQGTLTSLSLSIVSACLVLTLQIVPSGDLLMHMASYISLKSNPARAPC